MAESKENLEPAAEVAVKAKAKKKASTKTSVKVEFTKSPTHRFNLAYNVGEQATVDGKQAEIMIDAGVAKKV